MPTIVNGTGEEREEVDRAVPQPVEQRSRASLVRVRGASAGPTEATEPNPEMAQAGNAD